MFVVIFGQPGCPFCEKSVDLAKKYQAERSDFNYRYVDIQKENVSKEDLSKSVGEEVTTVPQIFIDKQPIGGYTQFAAYTLPEEDL